MTHLHAARRAPLLLVCAIAAACRGGRGTPPAVDSAAAMDTLGRVIREQRLTTLARECYVFEDLPGSPPFSFTVREKHDARCGGDPSTAPRLFEIRWDPATGQVTTDAGRLDGGTDTLRR